MPWHEWQESFPANLPEAINIANIKICFLLTINEASDIRPTRSMWRILSNPLENEFFCPRASVIFFTEFLVNNEEPIWESRRIAFEFSLAR